MSTDDTGAATRSGVVWSSVAFAGTKALSFLSTAVLARLLTPEDFGLVAAILVFVGFVELGGDLGMRATVVYEQEKGITARVQTAFTVNVALVFTLTGLGIVLAGPVSAFFGLGDDVGLFRLACLAMPLRAFGNIADSLLLRELAFKERIIPELASSVVKAGASVGLAVAGFEAEALVLGVLAGNLTWSVVQWNRTGFRPDFSFDAGIARSMASYGGMAAAFEVVAVVANRLDSIVIGRELGERALGVYNVAVRVPELAIDSVSWTVSRVAFPALSRTRAEADEGEDDLAVMALGLVRFQALYAFPVAVGCAVLAEPLLRVLFGDVWATGAGVLAALSIMTAVRAATFPLGDVFKAAGKQGALVAANVVQLPLLVVGLILAAPEGITTVAWTRAGLGLGFLVGMVVLTWIILGISPARVAAACWPAVAGGLGVLLGAEAVHAVLAPDSPVVELLLGIAACGVGGVLALLLFARQTVRDVLSVVAPGRSRAADV